MKNLTTAIENGQKFAYATGTTTLEQAISNSFTSETREQAEERVMNEYKSGNPSDNSSLDTLIDSGKVWIWDLQEELNNI